MSTSVKTKQNKTKQGKTEQVKIASEVPGPRASSAVATAMRCQLSENWTHYAGPTVRS
jgi:hypothetical protein